jgi:hypothetical protein
MRRETATPPGDATDVLGVEDDDPYSVLASAVNHPDLLEPTQALFNHRILASLADAGVELDVMSPRPFAPPVGPYSAYSQLPETEPWGPYTVHHPRFLYALPKRLLYGLSGRSYAKRVPLYAERTFDVPDVVHAGHVYMDGYGMLPYCRAHDVPLFATVHGTVVNGYDSLPPGVRPQVREALEASTVCCVSEALTDRVRSIVDHDRVHTVPLGADPAAFPVERRDDLREELGVPTDATLVLFVGAFTEAKGVDDLLSVLEILDAPDAHFVFVGHAGDRREAIETTLRETGLAGRTLWKVPPEEVAEWFATADLLVLPSKSEGRPSVIYEAMASRTAVLATRVGGVPEQVVDGETGRLLPVGDTAALGESLAALLEDEVTLERMGEHGYERLLEEEWTWAGHAERLRRLHRAAIESE